MSLADELRDPQLTQVAGPVLKRVVLAAADRIEALEDEVGRLRYFVQTIDEHAEAISTEVAIALHTHGEPSHD